MTLADESLAERIATLPPAERKRGLKLTNDEAQALLYDWSFWARPKQLPPAGDWSVWLVRTGRGWGKTRVGAEWVRKQAETVGRIALVAPTAADARDIMVEGESGIIACSPPWDLPKYEPSKRRVTWRNGAIATLYSADEPDRLNGPQHGAAWCFVAGTMVDTPTGAVPIESLSVGNQVLTRWGCRRVTGIAQRLSTVGTVRFSSGAELTGTAQHPVLSLHGWTNMSDLRQGASVCAGVRPRTATLQPMSTGRRSISIGGSGSRRTVRSLLAATFTTAMAAARTTRSAISNWLRRCCIEPAMLLNGTWLSASTVGQGLGGLLISVLPQSVVRASSNERTGDGVLSDLVPIAGSSFRAALATTVVSVVSTWEAAGKATVYNLAVDGENEYVANGIVVHNCDELGVWRHAQDAWDMLQFGLRLGAHPRVVVTTTPKPTAVIRDLSARTDIVLTTAHTYENLHNLAPSFRDAIVGRYEGTRLGRQELAGELLTDVPGALWKRDWIDNLRVESAPGSLVRVVVGVDPATTSGENANMTGIITVGRDDRGHAYVLRDSTLRASPEQWRFRVVTDYVELQADRIIGEVNNGGDLVEANLRTANQAISYKAVHASRGKRTRAEPIAALYEQGKVHHVGGFAELEDQMCNFTPDARYSDSDSPDRVDALVWALTELMLVDAEGEIGYEYDAMVEVGDIDL